MSDNDLIRRGDAVLAVTAADKERLGANGARDFIRAIPAVQPSPDVAALEDEIAKLSDLCDCDCNDDDCVRCSHYPAILDQKRAANARVKRGEP